MTIRPARGLCLVKPVETAETFAGSRILLPSAVREGMAQYQVEIVAVGLPESCEDKHCERPHHGIDGTVCANRRIARDAKQVVFHPIPDALTVGAWVLVKPRSYIAADDLTDIYLVRQDCVEAVFRVIADAGA